MYHGISYSQYDIKSNLAKIFSSEFSLTHRRNEIKNVLPPRAKKLKQIKIHIINILYPALFH